MNLELRLSEPVMPRIATIRYAGVNKILADIKNRNLAKSVVGTESKQFANRKEDMRRRLMARASSMSFDEATQEIGRERLLLGLYLEYCDRSDASWLPPFDELIAKSVLGTRGGEWHAGRRRQATQLFFTHFDRLPQAGLSYLCQKLIEAYGAMDSQGQGIANLWRRYHKTLFTPISHQRVAYEAAKEESLPALTERFGIPGNGRFVECLRQDFLLNALRDCRFGDSIPALAEIEALKNERASFSLLLGAAALQIMIRRVANEGKRRWSGDWQNWIVRLGCDPRLGRNTGDFARWWAWASPEEVRLAQQGITGLTLRFFIEFLRKSLQGTDREPQFAMRSRFLMALFEAGKIQSARLALNYATYQRLDAKFRDIWSVAHLSQTTDETSMICLGCTDSIYIIEGTHTFGLRTFYKTFPIRGFWELPKKTYQDRELRISPADCHIFLPHDQGGNWVNKFFRELRSRFHIEWGDVNV